MIRTIDAKRFIRRNTTIAAPPLVPEIRLQLATEVTPLWQATETSLAESGAPPPYWAFAWAGGQALARFLLDRPKTVAGHAILDFGSGSGLVAIAAAKAGAAGVLAADIDRFAVAAITLNAALNGVRVRVTAEDIIGAANPPADIVTAGDICYERAMAERVMPWLRQLASASRLVLLGDPGRAYLPAEGLVELARYAVPTSRELEDRDIRDCVVWRVLPD